MVGLALIEAPDNSITYNFLQKYQLQMVISMQRLHTFCSDNLMKNKKSGEKKVPLQKKLNVKSLLNRDKHIL